MRGFSFGNTIVLVNGVEITEWADGDDAISIKRAVESATAKVGAGGSMMVSVSTDKSGDIGFKLQQTSPSNAYLQALVDEMELLGWFFAPVSVRFQDLNRQDLAAGSFGFIHKPADMQRGEKANNQEWTITVEKLLMVYGKV